MRVAVIFHHKYLWTRYASPLIIPFSRPYVKSTNRVQIQNTESIGINNILDSPDRWNTWKTKSALSHVPPVLRELVIRETLNKSLRRQRRVTDCIRGEIIRRWRQLMQKTNNRLHARSRSRIAAASSVRLGHCRAQNSRRVCTYTTRVR